MKIRHWKFLFGGLCALAGSGALWGAGQTDNYGIPAVPAPGKVAVDGKLDDWDWSGRIQCFADRNIREQFSGEVAAMYDSTHLYLAVRRKDPSPMYNVVDPALNPNDGWKGDSIQLRFLTDRPVWLTAWYFTEKQQSAVLLEYGKDAVTPGGGPVSVESGENGALLKSGIRQMFRKEEDGRGYVQELAIPWNVLFEKVPEIRSGTVFRMGVELLWGDTGRNAWPAHRYADNIRPGQTEREFFWSNMKAWGDVTLTAAGNVPLRTYPDAVERLAGPIALRITLPAGAEKFTVAINAPDGRRVRNLAGAFPVADYLAAVEKDGRQTVEIRWDGLDDWGKPVPAGSYRAVGLSHNGLRAFYDASFYNPGTPPWQTPDGTGGWGADHYPPRHVAASGDRMILGWEFAEGGAGIIGVGPDGRRQWGEIRGASVLAADDDYVYAVINSWHGTGKLCRFDGKTGTPRPFVLNGAERPFELPLEEILNFKRPEPGGDGSATIGDSLVDRTGTFLDMGAAGGTVALLLRGGTVAVIDGSTGVLRRTLKLSGTSALACRDGKTALVVRNNQIGILELENGGFTPLECAGVERAGGIAVARDGRIAVIDNGKDSQVKVYAADGKFLYAAGQKGGRPRSGRFEPQGMMAMSSVAFDRQGQLWVTENWEYPRRVSVWGQDGRLVRDYIGNATYAGAQTFLHDTDPDLAYAAAVEMRLNRADGTFKVESILWAPDEERNEAFPLVAHTGHWFPNASFLVSEASGQPHRYLYFQDDYNAVYMERNGRWQPVAALGFLRNLPRQLREGAFSSLSPDTGFYWNDANRDGAVSPDECRIAPGLKLSRAMTAWGKRLGNDLSIYADGIVRYKPVKFTADGAPVYGPEGFHDYRNGETGDLLPVDQEDLLLCLSFRDFPGRTPGMLGLDRETGKVRWSYPNLYPSVHGSHRAPMPRDGMLIGPLMIAGTAEVSPEIGRVFLLRGNLGQDFYLTTDGLYVGALYQDTRLPVTALPVREERNFELTGFSGGGEPFCGWFGRQRDGKFRSLSSIARLAGMITEIRGLESIRRFTPLPVIVDASTSAKIRENAVQKQRAPQQELIHAVPLIAGWQELEKIPVLKIRREGDECEGDVRLGHDKEAFYLSFSVKDRSPMRNGGRDFHTLFKTGDAVDWQLAIPQGGENVLTRLLFTQMQGKPVAVLTCRNEKKSDKAGYVYHSPVMDYAVDSVKLLPLKELYMERGDGRYQVRARIPFEVLGVAGTPGTRLESDFGVIAGDEAGTVNVSRLYWANRNTNLVNDLPSEAQLLPDRRGTIELQ